MGAIGIFSFRTQTTHATSWYSASWPYRKAITINHSQVSQASGTTLSNFPVLIDIASDTNLASFASSTGADILFTAADGTTKLSHEIESYSSSTGSLVAWVNVPSLSPATNTIIYLYFGNASNTTPQQNVTGTWDGNFVGVYHFPSPGGTLSGNDSTADANNGTIYVNNCGGGCAANTSTVGEIDGGVLFPGSPYSLPVKIASSTSLNIGGPLTLESWFNTAAIPSNFASADLIYGDSGSSQSYLLALGSDSTPNRVYIQAGDDISGTDYPPYYAGYATTTLATSTWYHVAATFTGTQWLTYLDGTLVATVNSTTTPPPLTYQVDIGGKSTSGNPATTPTWNLAIDEARISNVARSADWISTEYNNVANLSTFETLGSIQTDAVPTISSFSASPIAGSSAVSSTLSWNVVGANTISITPGTFTSASSSGSTTINVTSTTVFTLSANNSNGTSTATTTVSIDTIPPSAPTNLVASPASSSAINLSWTASTDNIQVAGYDIYRGTSTSTITQVATSSGNSYTDSGLASSTTYYYQVDAYDEVANTSTRSSIASATTVSANTTVINVSSTVDHSGAKRFGTNLGSYDNYDGAEMYKNLVADAGDPGFEGQLYQTVLPCSTTANANDCSDASNSWASYNYGTWPDNFWAGATYEVITGQAAGRMGTILASNEPVTCGTSYPCGPTDLTLSSGTPAIGLNDFIVLRKTVNDVSIQANQNSAFKPFEGWNSSNVFGTPTTSVDLSDLASSSPGTQALQINALGSGNTFGLTQYFDGCCSYPSDFVRLNGTYELQFKAKGLGGTNTIGVDMARIGLPDYLSTTTTLTNSWQTYTYDFTANETGAENADARLDFNVANADIYIDDVSLQQINTDPTNNTVFADGIVDALKVLKPGILRDWSNQLGDSLDNSLATQFARKTAHYSINYSDAPTPIGLNDFLQLCQAVGAEPWYVIPTNWDPSDMTNLMQFLGGNGSTTYGAKRIALNGTSTPWTSVFPKIHLEFGNENWNVSTFTGGVIGDAASYATRGNELFTAAKASPYYSSSIFQFILGNQFGNTNSAVIFQTDAPEADAIAEAPYLEGDNNSSTASNNASAFGSLYGEVEYDSHGGPQSQVVQSTTLPIVDYEEGMATDEGSITQAQINAYVPSLGAGLATGNAFLMQLRDLGITDQNFFNLDQYAFDSDDIYGNAQQNPIYGEVIDPENTGRVRPEFLSQELANDAIGTAASPNIMVTTQTGNNPTWTQTIENGGSPITNITSHFIQAYAFSNHNIVLFNLSTTSSLPVQLTGADLPSGNVTVKQLTSGSINNNNETTTTVAIATQNYTSFDPTQTITLPPFSMTDYLQNATSTDVTPPSTPTGLTATATSSSEIDLSWIAATDNVGVTGYNIFQCIDTACAPNTLITTTNGTSYANTGLLASTTYGYAIAAFDAAGNISTSSVAAYATTPTSTSNNSSTQSSTPGPVVTYSGGGGGGGGGYIAPIITSTSTTSSTVQTSTLTIASSTATTTTSTLEALLSSLIEEYKALIAKANSTGIPITGNASPTLTRNLAPGSEGSDVTALQKFLVKDGDYPQAIISGYYGSLTEAAVKVFQAKYGIINYGTPGTTGYGAVGPKTRKKINEL